VSGAFQAADLSVFPDPTRVSSDDLAIALLVLWIGRDALGLETLSPGEIATHARDDLGINLSRQRIEAMLSGRPDLVARRRMAKKWRYQIMQGGIDYVSAAEVGVLFIDPEQALSRVRAVQDLFTGLNGIVRICDPYVAPRSLDFLVQCTRASEIRLLTGQVQKVSSFRSDLKATGTQLAIPIEIRVAADGVLHDRYVIDESDMLIIGTSLNGIGNKQSMIVHAGQDLRDAALVAFDRTWNRSKKF
jgi:hypothetical protein